MPLNQTTRALVGQLGRRRLCARGPPRTDLTCKSAFPASPVEILPISRTFPLYGWQPVSVLDP